MSSDDAQTVITACIGIGVASAIVADFYNNKTLGKPSATEVVKPIIGGVIAGAFLFGIAMINEDVAKGFAILFVAAALVHNGNGLFSIIDKVLAVPATVVPSSTKTSGKANPGHAAVINGQNRPI